MSLLLDLVPPTIQPVSTATRLWRQLHDTSPTHPPGYPVRQTRGHSPVGDADASAVPLHGASASPGCDAPPSRLAARPRIRTGYARARSVRRSKRRVGYSRSDHGAAPVRNRWNGGDATAARSRECLALIRGDLLLVRDSQLPAPLQAPSLQDGSPTTSAHSSQESMDALPT